MAFGICCEAAPPSDTTDTGCRSEGLHLTIDPAGHGRSPRRTARRRRAETDPAPGARCVHVPACRPHAKPPQQRYSWCAPAWRARCGRPRSATRGRWRVAHRPRGRQRLIATERMLPARKVAASDNLARVDLSERRRDSLNLFSSRSARARGRPGMGLEEKRSRRGTRGRARFSCWW